MGQLSTAIRRAVDELLPLVDETLTFNGNTYECISESYTSEDQLETGGFQPRNRFRFIVDAQDMLTTDSTLVTMDSELYTMDHDRSIPVAGNRNVVWNGKELRVTSTEYRRHSETMIITCGAVDQ